VFFSATTVPPLKKPGDFRLFRIYLKKGNEYTIKVGPSKTLNAHILLLDSKANIVEHDTEEDGFWDYTGETREIEYEPLDAGFYFIGVSAYDGKGVAWVKVSRPVTIVSR
jgi:hypothetical protein